jgi:hypothetical protein
MHGLINYIDTKANQIVVIKKKFTYKKTLRQMFTRVYRLEGDRVSHVGILFSTQLCELLPR